MNTNDIVEEAKKRLAEIEAEAARLRAIIAAAGDKFWSPHLPAPSPAWIPYPVYVPMTPIHVPVRPLDRVTCTDIVESPSTWFVDGAAYRTEYHTTPFSLSIETVRIGGPQTFDPNARYTVS